VGDHLGQIYEKRGEKDRALKTYALALSGDRPIPETRDRLAGLAGGNAKVDVVVAKYKEELLQSRTINLGKATKENGTADFFVLLSRGAGSAATVEGVKFVSGDEKLNGLSDALRTADYQLAFPDDTPVKILRRGVLSCSTAAGHCTLVLLPSDDVRTVD
jgi:hypothetical protein